MKYWLETDKDYIQSFINCVWGKLNKTYFPVFVTLISIYVPIMTSSTTTSFKDYAKELLIYFVCIEIFFFFFFCVYVFITNIIHYKARSKLALPYGISVTDISPYLIEEERTDKEYTFDCHRLTFNVKNTTTYKVKGGCSSITFIEHCFSGLDLVDTDKLTVTVKSLSGKPIVEAEAVKELTLEKCIVVNTPFFEHS